MATDSKKKTVMDETMGTINAALTILDRFPEMEDDNFSISVDLNPISFILNILYQTVGYDAVLHFISSKVLTEERVKVIEMAVKTFILSQLKLIFDCTVNPFITYDLLKYGVVFDLKTVDMLDMFRFSPLDKSILNKNKNGKWYYFGCEEFDYPDQLEQCEDFNALLWYMKNRTVGSRSVWYGSERQKNSSQYKSLRQKQKRTDGIITLEYSGRPTGLKDAEGNGMVLQTPFNNCIHVFIGNTKPIESGNMEATNNDILAIKEKQGDFFNVKRDAESIKNNLNEKLNKLNTNGLSRDEVREQKNGIKNYISYMDAVIKSIDRGEVLSNNLSTLETQGIVIHCPEVNGYKITVDYGCGELFIPNSVYNGDSGLLSEQKKQLYDDVILQHTHDDYREIKDNYYYHKTLFQFNIDYIFSLKLFDPKTLSARLLDALSGCLTVGLDLSMKERMVRNEVRQMVHDMIDSDDIVVSDCFFVFDNESYNAMIERSENQRLGLFVAPNGMVGQPIDPDAIMRTLNELSPNASPEQLQSAIESSLFEVTRQIYPEYDEGGDAELDMNWRSSIIDNLMQTLAYIIVLTVLSPALYLLIAVNLKIMGRETNFDLTTFIDGFKQLISGIVKTIRDELIRMFKEWLMEIIGELAKDMGAKLALEQMMYYQQLLRKCIECFNRKNGTLGWNMAGVEYADIYDTENNEPVNAEC